ncbi:hypothetical protein VTK73DRAFT_4623 [Phialemonium thermophilum]|uniref:K Homology domain-containing protein n=1 Tax=Phialemonium thermophilum TaxID=223376 RepID=A0ABR3V7A5_9PEZI
MRQLRPGRPHQDQQKALPASERNDAARTESGGRLCARDPSGSRGGAVFWRDMRWGGVTHLKVGGLIGRDGQSPKQVVCIQ